MSVENTTVGQVQIGSLHHTKTYSKGNKYFYSCVCLVCGSDFIRESGVLKLRNCTNGCTACSYKERGKKLSLGDGHAGLTALYASYRHNAKKRGRDFLLTREEFTAVTQQPCLYCGALPSQQSLCNAREHTRYTYNGLDRVDNGKGYTPDNVVPCCKTCNLMKRDLSVTDFINQCRLIGGSHASDNACAHDGGL